MESVSSAAGRFPDTQTLAGGGVWLAAVEASDTAAARYFAVPPAISPLYRQLHYPLPAHRPLDCPLYRPLSARCTASCTTRCPLTAR